MSKGLPDFLTFLPIKRKLISFCFSDLEGKNARQMERITVFLNMERPEGKRAFKPSALPFLMGIDYLLP